MPPIYKIKDLEVRLDSHFCLKVADLTIERGTIRSIVGPNGSGKSTLLRLLALLLKPDSGQLSFDGHALDPDNYQPWELRRRVTLVDQSPYLLQGSLHRNLSYGLKIRDVARKEQSERIRQALSDVGLAYSAKRSVKQLSGGEKQRLALARALVLQTDVLLLDEPTANIDYGSLPHFEQLLQHLARNGTTILMSTHVPEQARRLGADVIQVEQGRVTDARQSSDSRPAPAGPSAAFPPCQAASCKTP
jgi:tungstate transport system ATP-binding protein